ncbi:MAG: glycoside hydrolase family 127 protein [Arachnia sp.]
MDTISSTTRAPAVPISRGASAPPDLADVTLDGGFLGEWQLRNTQATIPHVLEHLESSGVLDNFRRLIGESTAAYRGQVFADSDLYKTLEALGWEAVAGRASHAAFTQEALRLISAVQTPDGYVNSCFQGPRSGERFSDLREGHELYCLGHLIQAAIAWHHAGEDALLQIALGYVDLVHTEFGQGGRDDVCGHPEIETALVELARVTKDARHRNLAMRFVDNRGHDTLGPGYFGGHYYQDLVPVRDSHAAVGHAVRQLYLVTGAADIAADTHDPQLDRALDRIWADIHTSKLYVTGGLGSRHRGESFGDAYELPADRAYSETCAAIANFHWNWRMLLSRGDACYADEMERGLYNAIAAATAHDGRAFFYSNPLHLRTGHMSEVDAPSRRQSWYACACCPPNLARLLASITGYLMSTTDEATYVHLYTPGRYRVGPDEWLTISTSYPWEETISLTWSRPSQRTLKVRIPRWARAAALTADDAWLQCPAGSYADIPAGTTHATLTIPLQPQFVAAHPRVDAARASVAVRRGPVIYCLEAASLPSGVVLEDLWLAESASIDEAGWHEALNAPALRVGPFLRHRPPQGLYSCPTSTPPEPIGALELIPYSRWANRESGAMRVWLPTR